ncbi:MAG TPA: hypothetical protein VHA13_06155, partial [Gammaproteobacteria bacterium]|nr:hypothetical protein [Gammaproteobacteria bacterium]
QKAILDATFKIYIDDIIEDIPDSSIMILEALCKEQITSEEIEGYKKIQCPDEGNIWDMYIKPWHEKIHHPYLQNRAKGDPSAALGMLGLRNEHDYPETEHGIFEGKVYYFKNGFGTGVLSEPVGCFSLTSRNDSSAPPVTREATYNYIKNILTTNIRGLKQSGNHYSCLKPKERISEKQWYIGISTDIGGKHSSIYLEGLTDNGIHFIDYYRAEFSTFIISPSSITLTAKSIYPFQIEENLLEEKIEKDLYITPIDNAAGITLRIILRNELANWTEISKESCMASSIRNINTAGKWAISKCKEAHLAITQDDIALNKSKPKALLGRSSY